MRSRSGDIAAGTTPPESTLGYAPEVTADATRASEPRVPM